MRRKVLNGLDYSRTTFRNNNEYKISKKLTLNQNFSFGITKSNPKPLMLLRMLTPIIPVRFQLDNMASFGNDGFAGTTGSSLTMWVIQLRN
jgi:hypothetical protein